MRLANLPLVALNLVNLAARRLARRWRENHAGNSPASYGRLGEPV